MTRPKVSVALATFNGARFLREQLESLAAQTRLPDELVVSDDGSTDDTEAILEKFSGAAPFPVRLARNPATLGATRNFEEALRRCSGDLLALCDQDDVWHADKLQRLEEALLSSTAGLAFSDADVADEELRPQGFRLWETVGFGRTRQQRMAKSRALEILVRDNVVTGATMMFRTLYREAVFPIPAIWRHDAWIALIIASRAGLLPVPLPLLSYRQHSGQLLGAALEPGPGRRLEWLRRFRRRNTEAWSEDARRYEAARDRLARLGRPERDDRLLQGKIEHLRTRIRMPASRLLRLPSILRELAFRRYHRYSNGFSSLFKDLALP